MDICATFIANLEPPETVQPRVCTLDNPAMTPESLLRLDTLAGNSRRDATPRRAALFFFDSYPLSACSLSGRLRGRPRGRLIGSIASRVGSSIVVSLTLAAVNKIASGMP